MKNRLKEFFDTEKIEYFSVLPYSECKVLRPDIMAREDFLPKSVIIFLIPYYGGECLNISRYAASRDYHIYVKEITEKLASFLKCEIANIRCKGYGDHSPIDERDAAAKCNLGIIGDNGLLINEKYGSYVFIAELVCNAEPALFGDFLLNGVNFCEHCAACRNACPTKRLSTPDAPCLSAVTQKRGELSADEKEIMKKVGSAWGCDLCQQVCPHNAEPKISPIPFFTEDRITELTGKEMSQMSDVEFSVRAFSWRGRKTVLRNLDVLEK